jgi:hypothetical protein
MTRRQHLLESIHNAIITTEALGIHVRKTFVLSQQKNYQRPFAKAEIIAESFDYEREEAGRLFIKSFDGAANFAIYAGVGIATQDTSDGALLEQETERVLEILTNALHDFDYQDATLDNGATLVLRNVYVTGLVPAVLDNEMQGNLLIEGIIEYSQYPP